MQIFFRTPQIAMELRYYPDPILRKRADPLGRIDDDVRLRVSEMFEIMYREQGVGLAAPQVGWSTRLFVMNPAGPDHTDEERVFINPRLIDPSSDTEIDEEGCLSIPDVRGKVERSLRLDVEAQDLTGTVFQQSFEALPARIIQHEFDHLDGILFVSRLSQAARLLVKKDLKRLERLYRENG